MARTQRGPIEKNRLCRRGKTIFVGWNFTTSNTRCVATDVCSVFVIVIVAVVVVVTAATAVVVVVVV